jgi:hypothetical protein
MMDVGNEDHQPGDVVPVIEWYRKTCQTA